MILFLIGVAAFTFFRLNVRSKLRSRIDAIRAAGYPVTCAELDQWYTIPEDAENAAYIILDAFEYYQEPQDIKLLPVVGQAELPPRTGALAEEIKAAVAGYIADNKKALELLHAGTAIENCRYPVDLSAGAEATFHDLSRLKKGARLLSLEALSHADSDPNLAVRSIVSAFGLARSLESEPTLISQLVRIACQGLAVSSLGQLMNRTNFEDEQLVNLSEAVLEARAPSAMSRAFVGERCMYLTTLSVSPMEIARLISDEPDSVLEANLTNLAFTLHRLAGLTDRSTIIYLDLMEEYIEAAQLPFNERREAFEVIDARCREVWRKDFVLPHLMGAIKRSNEISLRCIAHLRAAQTVIAVQRYRLATGELPDALADLLPTYLEAVPKDPFDGNELRYKKLEPGFVVYSVGEDLSDDGGQERLPPKERRSGTPNWDVTFIVER